MRRLVLTAAALVALLVVSGCEGGHVHVIQNPDGTGQAMVDVLYPPQLVLSEDGESYVPECTLDSPWGRRWDDHYDATIERLGADAVARTEDHDRCGILHEVSWEDDEGSDLLAKAINWGHDDGPLRTYMILVPRRNGFGGWYFEMPSAYFSVNLPSGLLRATDAAIEGVLSGTMKGTVIAELPGERLYDNAHGYEPTDYGGVYTWDMRAHSWDHEMPHTIYAETASAQYLASLDSPAETAPVEDGQSDTPGTTDTDPGPENPVGTGIENDVAVPGPEDVPITVPSSAPQEVSPVDDSGIGAVGSLLVLAGGMAAAGAGILLRQMIQARKSRKQQD